MVTVSPYDLPQLIPILEPYSGPNGKLRVLGQDGLPFAVRREFTLLDCPRDAVRGEHAHRDNVQIVVVQCGQLVAKTCQLSTWQTTSMCAGEYALLIPPMNWLELIEFESGTVATVLCSHPYSESDYIRDRAEFDRLWKERGEAK